MAEKDVKPNSDAKDTKPAGDDPAAVESKAADDSANDSKGEESKLYTQSDLDSIADKVIARKDREAQEALESQKDEAERTRLVEEGKYQELAEKYKGETESLKAERERAKFIGDAHEALKDLELSDFQDVLLKDSATVDGVKERATELSALIEVKVEAEVAKRLNTEPVPKTPKPGPEDPNWGSTISTEDWKAKKKLQGIY